MIKWFRNIPLFYKITLVPLSVTILGLAISYFYLMPAMERHLMNQSKISTRNVVETVVDLLNSYEERVQSRTMSLIQAQASAAADIARLRYNGKQYFWVNDLIPRMIVHPYRPELVGKDLSEFRTPHGELIFNDFIKIAKKEGSGFIEYDWANPGELKSAHKLSYVKLFAPWGWVVGSGIHFDEVIHAMNEVTRRIFYGTLILSVLSFIGSFLAAGLVSGHLNAAIAQLREVAKGNFKLDVQVESRDELGQLSLAIRSMARDLNESREKEQAAEQHKEKVRRHLLYSSKLTALGTLAGGIAHEINNPLTILNGNVDIIAAQLDRLPAPDSRLVRAVENVHVAVERIVAIVQTMIRFAEPKASGREPVNFHEVIERTAEMFKPLYAREGISLEYRLESGFPMVDSNWDNLQQLIMNLVSNARDAVLSSSSPKILIRTYDEQEKFVFTIQDNGCGIPSSELGKVFDPFYTTKPPGKGVGLGLSEVHSIINELSGVIEVHSTVQQGSVFTIHLPRSKIKPVIS